MRKYVINNGIILMLFTNSTVFGYIYHLSVMKRVNKKTGQEQHVIGLADFHNKIHPANKIQRNYIDNVLLKRCSAVKGKFIVEDLSSINNDGQLYCCNFGINSCEGVLGQLANKARLAGVLVDNVEYRYCRVAGIGPLLSNITTSPYSFKSTSAITMASLHEEVVREIEKIKEYNDSKKLNAFYKRTIDIVYNALSKIAFNVTSTIAHYCVKFHPQRYQQELEKLCIFDSAIIDMKIMHAIAVAPEAPYIIVVAGGSHIEQMSAMLKNIGYESVFVVSQPTTIPIDITVLDRFMK